MLRDQLIRAALYSFLFACATGFAMEPSAGFFRLREISNYVMISRALYVAADLELADHLSVPLLLEDLAQKAGVDHRGLHRLVRCLMEYGVFCYTQNGLICNNEDSPFLKKDHPQTIRPFILHDDPMRWNAIGNLGYSIKTSKPSFDELYGMDYFAYLNSDSLLSERFDEAMAIISQQEDERIAQMISFSGTVADIGGGKGQLLECIAKNNNQIEQLILFDLQQVQNNVVLSGASMMQIVGSFFDPITFCADTFILKRILHDWDDQKAGHILSNVAQAMNEDTVLYIIDAVIDQCQDKKLILDIDLRLLSIFGGQERTRAEFEALCSSAGLEIVQIRELTLISHVIECRKVKGA